MGTPSLVSAILVNWNGAQDLELALPSLVTQTYTNLEILVVDNGSVDTSRAVVERFEAAWMPLGRNLGLAGAMNEGASAARGEFLLFLNNDMRFAPDFVRSLVDVLEEDPQTFAVDAKQFDWDGAEVVHCCTALQRTGTLRGDIPGWRFEQRDEQRPTPCIFCSAAGVLVRRSMFEAVGGWDPKYPVGWEDVDLCWRAWARGWGCVYVPNAVSWHRVGASSLTSEGAGARLRGALYGRLRFALKNLPLAKAALLIAATFAKLPFDLVKGKIAIAATRIKVAVSLVHDAPEIGRGRMEIRRTSGGSLQSLISRMARATQNG